jgi:hypothetical protein
MTSTDRLLAVLRGAIPDRVPISTYELVGWNPGSFENRQPSYRALMDFIRETTDCLYMTHVPIPNLRAGEVEVRTETWDDGDQHCRRETIHAPGRALTTVTSKSDDVNTRWTREPLLKDLDDLDAWVARPWEPGEPDFGPLEKAWADLAGTKGLPLVSFADPLCAVCSAFEFGAFTVLAITDTDAIQRALDAMHERLVETLRRLLAGPVEHVVFRLVGAEYASPPYLPPELFRRFVTGYNTEYTRMIQEAGGFARLHCHGRVGRLLDQIREMGVDGLDPVEPPPDGDVDVAGVKATIGDRVCLMGGIELKHLEVADGAFIEQLVRDTMAQGKPGGRFVIMPTAAPINIPLRPQTEENYRRFIETALEVGAY